MKILGVVIGLLLLTEGCLGIVLWVSVSRLNLSESRRSDLEQVDKYRRQEIVKMEESLARTTSELTDSVVQLRKLDGLVFHLIEGHDLTVGGSTARLVVSDASGEVLKDLDRTCSDLNGVSDFVKKQRSRVHWDLDDPEPALHPMTENEFAEFIKQLKKSKHGDEKSEF